MTKSTKKSYAVLFIFIISFSNISVILGMNLTSNFEQNTMSNKKNTILQFGVSDDNNEVNNEYKNRNLPKKNNETVVNNPICKPIPDKECNKLQHVSSLIHMIVNARAILHYDLFRKISSDPIKAVYSDELTVNSKITRFCNKPISDKNVTFYIYKYTEYYPEFILNRSDLSKIFDMVWFYLYFYNWSSDLINEMKQTKYGDWILSYYEFIMSCFSVIELGTTVSDECGKAELTKPSYITPGMYHMITLVELYISPWCHPNHEIDYDIFRIFHDHVEIKKETTIIEERDLEVRYSDLGDISIQLFDNDGNSIPQDQDIETHCRSIKFYLKDNQKCLKEIGEGFTDESGMAIIYYTPWLESGSHELLVKFSGDKYYKKSNLSCLLHVSKEKTQIIMYSDTSVINTDEFTLTSCLMDDDGNTIPQTGEVIKKNRLISYYIEINGSWELLDENYSNEGYSQITLSILLPEGDYLFKSVFSGDVFYSESVQFGVIKVSKETTIISIYSDYYEVQTTDSIVLTANLTDDEHNPLSLKQVSYQIKIDGTWITISTVYTDEKGIATYIWEVSINPGGYQIRAIFFEDEFYEESFQEGFIEIQKEQTNLKILTTNSNSFGKYEVQAQLIDDDSVPISGEEITIEINGNAYKIATDDDGFAKKKIANTFEDLNIKASYKGSGSHEETEKSQIKKFTTELETFFKLSVELMIDLLEEFGDDAILGNIDMKNLAPLLLEILDDLQDGKLDDYLKYLSEINNILGIDYFLSAFYDNAYFKFPWTDGLASVYFTFVDAANTFWDDWAPFTPSPSNGKKVSLGTTFSSTHTFYNVVEWIEENAYYTWKYLGKIGLDELLEALGWTLSKLLSYGSGSKVIGDYKYVWEIVSGVFDWAKKYKKDWHDKLHYFDKTLSKSFTMDLSDFPNQYLKDLFDTSLTQELFWKKIGDLWYLGFDHLIVGYDKLLSGFLDLLELMGIDLWEIFEFLIALLNSRKAEHLKQLFRSKESMLFSRIEDEALNGISEMVSIFPDANIVNDIDVTNYFSNDLIYQELDLYSAISIPHISLSEDEVTNREDLVSKMLPAINLNFGMMMSSNDLMDIIDLFENNPSFDVNLDDLTIDLSLFNNLEFNIENWDIKIIKRFSDIFELIRELQEATPFPEFFEKLSQSESIEQALIDLFFFILEFFQSSIYYDTAEAIIDVIASNDLLIWTKKDAEFFLCISQILDLIRSAISIIDGISDMSLLDETSKILMAILQGSTGTLAAYLTDDEVFEVYSEYFAKQGFGHIPNLIIETLVDLIGKHIFSNYWQKGDCVADIVHAIISTIKVIIDLATSSTFNHFNQLGEVHAWTMSINHFVKKFSKIIIGISEILIEKIPYYIKVYAGVAAVHLISLGGQSIFTHLAIYKYY
ncbi:hypothetical protein AC481_06240 [miscellaneous Crenarchaeota group archaeon SMTZ-80]|nr:MAG: hypothetical protein AC481_06240 [miscellaneous Crenarchaeota group archaeon SMTZ-80]